uniref:Uncharacterized protein n=1 Tax=Sipha flava TaxID=143950 RepID=A0A2S2QWN4_9HEMI
MVALHSYVRVHLAPSAQQKVTTYAPGDGSLRGTRYTAVVNVSVTRIRQGSGRDDRLRGPPGSGWSISRTATRTKLFRLLLNPPAARGRRRDTRTAESAVDARARARRLVQRRVLGSPVTSRVRLTGRETRTADEPVPVDVAHMRGGGTPRDVRTDNRTALGLVSRTAVTVSVLVRTRLRTVHVSVRYT